MTVSEWNGTKEVKCFSRADRDEAKAMFAAECDASHVVKVRVIARGYWIVSLEWRPTAR